MTNGDAIGKILMDLLGRPPTLHEVTVVATVFECLTGLKVEDEVDRDAILP
jgi:hypothetical protein